LVRTNAGSRPKAYEHKTCSNKESRLVHEFAEFSTPATGSDD